MKALARHPPMGPFGASPVAGVFASPDARSKVVALYDSKLAGWPVSFEELDVPTRYGKTHVVASGDRASPALLLVHPAGCAAFIWRTLIAPLAGRYRTYAIDTIGDVGKSVLRDPDQYPRNGRAYAAWLTDVLDALGVERTDVLGWSMGGWISLHFAANRPDRVRRVALLGPMGLPSWPATLRVLFRLAAAEALPSPSRKERLIAWAIGRDPRARQEVGDWMDLVIDTRCKPKLGNPYPVPAMTFRSIRAPVLVVLGGQDGPIGAPRRVAKRARTHLHDVEIEILPENSHALGVEAPDRIVRRVLTFFAEAGGPR